ncbi:NAD(P)-dependent dehydrogenase (short-subunit alcohol dehydrogenase family)/acyl dehydratase [Natronocella acetinitrilica]|uniref:NAD(P)-dependent dehydrogenase (Short-subunit alcohol dehydrogenase family)/acyl dehydratase n=1 Tax=Natronocella acetinitrilica TaxID=414046 RepID=A0AAE3G4R3_9GAMM|nr:SDR family oxidoreductase [Natronocella acetinitrilica]MCP1675796.1 NAD(P)-dependent dehydrogenase (short-subunit alcohol dehydrogenase family)/acyl dehydratase [Natronocella acetinitrilica]
MDELSRTVHLSVTDAVIDAFADITGDRSALHTDPEFARRSRFRGRVAHGMLPALALVLLDDLFPASRVRLTTVKGRFLRAVMPGDTLRLELRVKPTTPGAAEFSADWYRIDDQDRTTRISGTLALLSGVGGEKRPARTDGHTPPLIEELDLSVEELEGRSERIRFRADLAMSRALAERVLQPMGVGAESLPSPQLLLMVMLSTLVGMRLPGRRATFLGFALDFSQTEGLEGVCDLRGQVTRLLPAATLLKADVSLKCDGEAVGSGTFEALVNEPASVMPSVMALRSEWLPLGLDGKVAVVVGGSRGLGETTAKFLALLGAHVTFTYFQGPLDAERVLDEITDAGGVARTQVCDVRDEASVDALFGSVLAHHDRLDILVNCAVHAFTPHSITSTRLPDFSAELAVSVLGLHTVCSRALPIMRRGGGGKIISFSSLAVRSPVSGQAVYIAAKAAVEGYTRTLALEAAADNVQVNLVAPAMTETDLVRAIPEAYRIRLREEAGAGRPVTPGDVAQAVAFLASHWSDAITGQTLTLSGGSRQIVD